MYKLSIGRKILTALTLAAFLPGSARAEDGVPDLKGVWTGLARALVYGGGHHHPGKESDQEPPRIHEVSFTYTVDGQDDRLVWGRTQSKYFNEPFAWAISRDNKNVYGADLDGQVKAEIIAKNQMELCYSQTALSPTKSIVATCFIITKTTNQIKDKN